MAEQTQEQKKGVPAELLNLAQKGVAGKNMEPVDPMESIPTLGVGKELTPGMSISGYYERTEEIPSPKSKQLNAAGERVFVRHILRIGSPTGERLGIWTTAALAAFFELVNPGQLVQIKYVRKGENEQGQAQHFFEFNREKGALNS